MDVTIGELKRFNAFLDSAIDPRQLDEEFIASRQAELDDLSKSSDVEDLPCIALSYAKLMELTVLLAGTYADTCRIAEFGDLVANPRHMDVCVLNTRLIQEEFGITDGIPLWFKEQVHECIGSRYAEDLGRMVVSPSLLLQFVEKGLLLRTVKKERHKRLSDQFRGWVSCDPRLTFPEYVEWVAPVAHSQATMPGRECGRGGHLDVASWLADNKVLNIVKGTLKDDLLDVLRQVMSDDYLASINKRFEKALNSLHYVSIGRESFADFPYDAEIPIAEWAEIDQTLCHFTLDGYGVIQSELDKSISNPCYKSPFLNRPLSGMPNMQDTGRAQMIRSIM